MLGVGQYLTLRIGQLSLLRIGHFPLLRIGLACTLSLGIYFSAFTWLLDRPLSLGALRGRFEANIAFGETIHTPKLVILAGSNGPYSHRCETIGPIIHRPCVNAGVAVGIGLDYLFARWEPLLHPGDIVYLPLEEAQYIRPRATVELGPDAAIMLRHDRATLRQLPLHRRIFALFAGDLRAAIMSVLEIALLHNGFSDPRAAVVGSYNALGDHIGHTAVLAAGSQSALAAAAPPHPSGPQIAAGYGTLQVNDFLRWAAAHDVRIVGGLPTGFADSPISGTERAAIRAIYSVLSASFLELPNQSRYPREAFFDTPDHLNEPAQIRHSITVADALRRLIVPSGDRPATQAPWAIPE